MISFVVLASKFFWKTDRSDCSQLPPNHFAFAPEEVLLEIFSHLEFKDLISCEEAYATWRSALTREAFWKSFFERNIKTKSEWLQIWSKLNKTEKFKDVSYRDRCKIVSDHIDRAKRSQYWANLFNINWENWQFEVDSVNCHLELKPGNGHIKINSGKCRFKINSKKHNLEINVSL